MFFRKSALIFWVLGGAVFLSADLFGQTLENDTHEEKDSGTQSSVQLEHHDIGLITLATVSEMTTDPSGEPHTDLMVTRTGEDGSVIWASTYGYHRLSEFGNGMELSTDEQYLYIVGSAQNRKGTYKQKDALVIKLRISDGSVVWSRSYGDSQCDEEALLIGLNQEENDDHFLITGTSSGDPKQSNERLYAFKINKDGGQLWSHRYLMKYNLPYPSLHPTDMVCIGENYVVTGLQEEVNISSHISSVYTLQIDFSSGEIAGDFIFYDIPSISASGNCSLVSMPDQGFGLAFSVSGLNDSSVPEQEKQISMTNDHNHVAVMRLDHDRRVDWANIYWLNWSEWHDAPSIYQNFSPFGSAYGLFNVGVNVKTFSQLEPGLMRLNPTDGEVVTFERYHPIHPLTADTEDGDPIQTEPSNLMGYTTHNNKQWIQRKVLQSENVLKKMKTEDYGISRHRGLFVDRMQSDQKNGESRSMSSEDISFASEPLRELQAIRDVLIYPSPILENTASLHLEFNSTVRDQSGVIRVYDITGKEIVAQDISFLNAEDHSFAIDATPLSSGIHLLSIESDNGVLHRTTFVKD